MSTIAHTAITSFNQGNAFYKSKNYEQALRSYEATLNQDNSFVHAYLWKAKALIQLARYEEGIECFIKEQNRYRDSKRESYAVQLINLLLEKGAPNKAMNLVQKLELDLKDNHLRTHLRLLFANENYHEGIRDLLQLSEVEMNREHNALLEGDSIPKKAQNLLVEERLIPRYVSAKKQHLSISKLSIKRKDIISTLSEVKTALERVKETKKGNYAEHLTQVESILENCKALVLDHGKLMLKTDNLKVANSIQRILSECHYDEEAVAEFTTAIKQKEQVKTKKQTRYAFIGLVATLVIGIISYYTVISFQKSSNYKEAIASNNLNLYNTYLSRYGDDDEIHRLREIKLYVTAIKTNHSNDINSLIHLYPKSKYLKTITINFEDGLKPNYTIFGIASSGQTITRNSANSFKSPIGSKVGISVSSPNKITVNKYFTVAGDMELTETMHDKETLLFEENFNSNKRGWTTFEDSKQVYGNTKYKGVKVNNGSLEMYHQFDDNNFVMSSIYINQLKRNINFKAVVTWQRKGKDNGTFLLFGATKRGFNYIGFDERKYLYGYNNWDKPNEKWIRQSKGWQYSNAINNSDYGANTLEVKKEGNTLEYRINGSYIGEAPLKKWYGRRLGFGINDNTESFIQEMKVYQIHSYISPEFTKDEIYFCSVQELNVRDGYTTRANVLTTIKRGDPVKYLGIKGKKKVNATLNDVFSPDYYYQVELLDGSKGWVHGGGITSLNTKEKLTMDGFRTIQESKINITN